MAKGADERRELIQRILGHEVEKRNRTYLRYIDIKDNEIDLSNTKFDI